MTSHTAHAVTCESCGCTRECNGSCTTCQVCGADWLLVACAHCGIVPVYTTDPEYRAIVDVTRAAQRGGAPLRARNCPHCYGEISRVLSPLPAQYPSRLVSAELEAALRAWMEEGR